LSLGGYKVKPIKDKAPFVILCTLIAFEDLCQDFVTHYANVLKLVYALKNSQSIQQN